MSQENVETVKRSFEAFDHGDPDAISQLQDPDIEWQTPREDPDAATYQGREAVRRYFDQWSESFESLHGNIEECIDVGDDRVFAWTRWTGRGRASGADAQWYLAIVYTFRDGKAVRAEEYFDRVEALEAVGLSE
jgi:ketosteroid isomerase-like protein